ncbi:hypothetical protein ON010_g4041 [Phytophthora cinnamomi]|nr:hypothetical protein ON010_g4041 [Phytophthora cinnamomi]
MSRRWFHRAVARERKKGDRALENERQRGGKAVAAVRERGERLITEAVAKEQERGQERIERFVAFAASGSHPGLSSSVQGECRRHPRGSRLEPRLDGQPRWPGHRDVHGEVQRVEGSVPGSSGDATEARIGTVSPRDRGRLQPKECQYICGCPIPQDRGYPCLLCFVRSKAWRLLGIE